LSTHLTLFVETEVGVKGPELPTRMSQNRIDLSGATVERSELSLELHRIQFTGPLCPITEEISLHEAESECDDSNAPIAESTDQILPTRSICPLASLIPAIFHEQLDAFLSVENLGGVDKRQS